VYITVSFTEEIAWSESRNDPNESDAAMVMQNTVLPKQKKRGRE
jgi:hypothetical protein